MVHWPTVEAMRKHIDSNFQRYYAEHPGEFLLLEIKENKFVESFYKTENELKEATKKYKKGTVVGGPAYRVEEIPLKTHRFDPNNITLEHRLDEHVTVCPNDNETELIGYRGIVMSGKDRYTQLAKCPDCGYQVFRRASDEDIKRVKENMKKRLFTVSSPTA